MPRRQDLGWLTAGGGAKGCGICGGLVFFAVIEAVGPAYLAPCLVGVYLAAEACSVSATLTSEIGPRLVTIFMSHVHVASVEARHYAWSLP